MTKKSGGRRPIPRFGPPAYIASSYLGCPSQPWLLEAHLLETLDLPLNLDKNKRHPFHPTLTAIRAEAAMRARALPALPNPGHGGTQID
jgi:hypothetical protein